MNEPDNCKHGVEMCRACPECHREAVCLTALLGGFVKVPIRESSFGKYLDLTGRIPADATCIMVMLNSGGGLNAGWPKPIGFLRLTHQLYLADLEKLLCEQAKNAGDAEFCGGGTRWVTVAPIRHEEYVDVWSVDPANSAFSDPEEPC